MLQVLRDGPRFQIADDRHFRLLLARIVENVIRDRHGYHTAGRRAPARERAISRESVLVLDPPRAGAATPSQITDQREQEAWVQLALELLEADDRRLIVAREWGMCRSPSSERSSGRARTRRGCATSARS